MVSKSAINIVIKHCLLYCFAG